MCATRGDIRKQSWPWPFYNFFLYVYCFSPTLGAPLKRIIGMLSNFLLFAVVYGCFGAIFITNTPGTAGGPGGRDRTLAVKTEKTSEKEKKITPQKYFFLHISSSYAKILGEKLFRTWEIPRSGSKAKNGEKEKQEREKEREKD